MPPKPKYTKEQILDVAFQMVRKHGMDILSARSLAAELGTSTAPIFTAFPSIEVVASLVVQRAKALYQSYFDEGCRKPLLFKSVGIQYVRFAKEEPQLFKLLFMGEDPEEEASHFFPSKDENAPAVLDMVERAYGISPHKAKALYNHLSVYTHGLAVLYAQGRCVYTMEDVSQMLTELFQALMKGE